MISLHVCVCACIQQPMNVKVSSFQSCSATFSLISLREKIGASSQQALGPSAATALGFPVELCAHASSFTWKLRSALRVSFFNSNSFFKTVSICPASCFLVFEARSWKPWINSTFFFCLSLKSAGSIWMDESAHPVDRLLIHRKQSSKIIIIKQQQQQQKTSDLLNHQLE